MCGHLRLPRRLNLERRWHATETLRSPLACDRMPVAQLTVMTDARLRRSGFVGETRDLGVRLAAIVFQSENALVKTLRAVAP